MSLTRIIVKMLLIVGVLFSAVRSLTERERAVELTCCKGRYRVSKCGQKGREAYALLRIPPDSTSACNRTSTGTEKEIDFSSLVMMFRSFFDPLQRMRAFCMRR